MFTLFYKLGTAKALAEFAPGIPIARSIDPLPTVNKSQTWQLAIQRHHADRAGEHLDLRLIDPKTNKAHSWAIPKAQMPAPGKSVLAVQQPTHTSDYATTFGKSKPEKITSGYGKGTVSLEHLSDIDVYHATPDLEGTRVRFNIYKGTHPEEYAIVRTSSGADILVNKTLSRERVTHLPIGSKPKLREADFHKIDTAVPSEVLMPKLDGAHTILDFPTAGRIPRLFSYRVGRRATTSVIEHTHKAPALLELRVPKDLAGTILRAETVAVNKDTGKALPAPTLAGLLNSSVTNSREQQKALNAELKPILFDIIKYKGHDVSDKSFTQRYTLLKDIAAQTKLDIVDVATTQKEKDNLLNSIKNQKHLLTTEGVILQRHQDSSSATKAKLRPDHDVYVRDIFEATDATGTGKKRAGGFMYSWTPKGPITGRVGTGFDYAEATAMLASPKDYVGRVAKVEAETKYPSGKLGKPAFKEWHLDKGKPFI